MGESKMRKQMIEGFISALKEDIIPWERNWELMEAPRNAVSENQYRGLNALWLQYTGQQKGYSDPRWCTFKQADEKGWRIKKGEKGTPIEFYSLYDKELKKNITIQEAEQLRVEMEPKDYNDRVIAVLKNSTVFNAEQINGIPAREKKIARLPAEQLLKQRDVLLKNMELKLEEGGDAASYSPGLDRIRMPLVEQFKDDSGYMATFLHEAAHATGHPKRLHRDLANPKGSPGYAREELRAELASAFVAQEFNIITAAQVKNHKAYIQDWIQVLEKNPNELFWAIKAAEQIADYLIEKGDFRSLDLIEEPIEEEEISTEPVADKEYAEEEIARELAATGQESPLEILGLYEWQGKGNFVHYINKTDGRQYLTNGKELLEDVDFQVMYSIRRNVDFVETKEIDSRDLIEKLETFHPEISFFGEQLWQMDKSYDGPALYGISEDVEKQEEKPLISIQEAAEVHMALKGMQVDQSKWNAAMYTAYEVGEEAWKMFQVMSLENRENKDVPWLIAERAEAISVLINHKNSERHPEGLPPLEVKKYICSLYANSREEHQQFLQVPMVSDYIGVSGKMAGMILAENPDVPLYRSFLEPYSDYKLQEVKEIPEKHDKKAFMVNKEVFDNRENFYPTITCEWSESPAFEDKTVYPVSEFNALMLAADRDMCEKQKGLVEKYGDLDSANENASAEEIKYLGYQKVKFTVDRKQGNSVTHTPERQDIGNGDGSVIDFLSLFPSHYEAASELGTQAKKELQAELGVITQKEKQTKTRHIANRNSMKRAGGR